MIERYDAESYMQEIKNVLNLALRNGLGIEIIDNKLSVCNTVAGEKATIDLSSWNRDINMEAKKTIEIKVV